MPVLINKETNLAEDLPAEHATAAAQSGSHQIPLNDPEGNPIAVDYEEAPKLLSQGYTQPNPDQLQKLLTYGKFSTPTEIAKTAAESAASAATFGLSTGLERAAGVSPEDIRLRQEINPVAHVAGQIGGLGASAFIPGVGAAGILEKAGAGAAEKLIPEAAGIIGQVGRGAVKGAVENALFQAGDEVSKMFTENPEQSVQTAITDIGLSGLFGGVVGGALSFPGAVLGRPKIPEATPVVSGAPQEATKIEGGIDFGMPDEKILKQAKPLNPGNPIKQNDLNWIKENGMPDAEGKPTIFNKIGTAEIPTLDPTATDQVYMGDVVKQGMENLQKERSALNESADKALRETTMADGKPLSMSRDEYKGLFHDVIKDIKESKEFGLPIGKKAVNALQTWVDAAEHMPESIPATDLRDILQNIRDEGKIYVKGGGLKNDFVSKSMEKVQGALDDFLKNNSKAYKDIQAKFALFTRNSIELEDHLNWNWQRKDSDLVSDWVTNRVAKPFQSTLPGTKHDADLMRWFSQYAGTDLEKASKANFIYGKLNPEAANAGQLGSWGSRVATGLDVLSRPTEIPGKVVKSTAKMLLTGEAPEFIQQSRTLKTQDLLLGKSSVNKDSFLNSSLDLLKRVAKGDNKITNAIKDIFRVGRIVAPTLMNDSMRVNRLQKKLDHYDQNPDSLLAVGSSLQTYTPAHSLASSSLANRAIQYLNSIKPKDQKLGPLDPINKPSKIAMAAYHRQLEIAEQPLKVLEHIKNGTLIPDDIATLKNIYPALYQNMSQKLMEHVIDAHAKERIIPYKIRLNMSLFLGQPLDSTMSSMSIQSNQPKIQQPAQSMQSPTPRKGSSQALSKIPGLFATPQQARLTNRAKGI